jgi:hypothetical protein
MRRKEYCEYKVRGRHGGKWSAVTIGVHVSEKLLHPGMDGTTFVGVEITPNKVWAYAQGREVRGYSSGKFCISKEDIPGFIATLKKFI